MKIIKLDATTSTNDYLKQLLIGNEVDDLTVVSCRHQTQGRGQRDYLWISEADKNLTFSILKRFNQLEAHKAFALICATSLAIYDVLNQLSIPHLNIKWPNDIMSGGQKICGILIENVFQGKFIKYSVVGVGLNVNQTLFSGLPDATSMQLASGSHYDLDELLDQIIYRIKHYLKDTFSDNYDALKRKYKDVLFQCGSKKKYTTVAGVSFFGVILGVSETGQLIVKNENGDVQQFNFKDIQYER